MERKDVWAAGDRLSFAAIGVWLIGSGAEILGGSRRCSLVWVRCKLAAKGQTLTNDLGTNIVPAICLV
jgi:hypothetical protein